MSRWSASSFSEPAAVAYLLLYLLTTPPSGFTFFTSYLRYKVAHKLLLSLQPPATAGTTISLSQVTLFGCWLHSLAGGKVDKMVTLSRLFSSQFIFSYFQTVGGRGCRRVDISSDHASAIRGSLLLVHFICILKRENILVGK